MVRGVTLFRFVVDRICTSARFQRCRGLSVLVLCGGDVVLLVGFVVKCFFCCEVEMCEAAAALVRSLLRRGKVLLFLPCFVNEGRGIFFPNACLANVCHALGWVLNCFFRFVWRLFCWFFFWFFRALAFNLKRTRRGGGAPNGASSTVGPRNSNDSRSTVRCQRDVYGGGADPPRDGDTS